MSKKQIAFIGECMIELAPQGDLNFHMNFAGDTLNTAVYCSRSLAVKHAVQVDYITAVGDDSFSDRMLRAWKTEGIGISHVRQISGKLPGLYLIFNDKSGESFLYYYRSQSAARALFEGEGGDELYDALLKFDTLYFSGITLAILPPQGRDKFLACLKEAYKKGIKICFDTNFRSRLWPDLDSARMLINKVLKWVTIGLPSFSDEQALFGDKNPAATAERFYNAGVEEIVVKQGERGYYLSNGKKQQQMDVKPAKKVIDTTGAGDAFNGVYLAARLQGATMEIAAQKAAELAATVVGYSGAIIPKLI